MEDQARRTGRAAAQCASRANRRRRVLGSYPWLALRTQDAVTKSFTDFNEKSVRPDKSGSKTEREKKRGRSVELRVEFNDDAEPQRVDRVVGCVANGDGGSGGVFC